VPQLWLKVDEEKNSMDVPALGEAVESLAIGHDRPESDSESRNEETEEEPLRVRSFSNELSNNPIESKLIIMSADLQQNDKESSQLF
jgi:hypothetical protein